MISILLKAWTFKAAIFIIKSYIKILLTILKYGAIIFEQSESDWV